MFKILDGRNKFYQWDKNRKLIVEDKSINEVHFCNRYGNTSIIRNTYEVEGLTLVDVPNVILQESFALHVYAFDAEYTKQEDVFNIVARTKPEDYINTEEDIRLWDELAEKLIDLENKVDGEGIQAAVIQYLTDNPPEAGATREEAAQIEQNKTDIEELQREVAAIEIPDVSNFATTGYVDEKIADIDFPEGADLTGYAKKTYVDDAIKNIKHPTPDLSGYAKTSDLTNYAKKSDIPSTSGLATTQYVDEAIEGIDLSGVDNAYYLDLTSTSNIAQSCAERHLLFINAFLEDGKAKLYIKENIATVNADLIRRDTTFYPAVAEKISDTEIKVTRVGVTAKEQKETSIYGIYKFYYANGEWKHIRDSIQLVDLVTSAEVSELVDTKVSEAIGGMGGGSGTPEVAIGTTEPTNGEVLWIDPEQSNDYVTKEQLQSDGSLVENPDGTISTAIGGSRTVVVPAEVAFEQSGSFTNKEGYGRISFGEDYGLNLAAGLDSNKVYRLKTVFKENATGAETVTDIKMTYEKYSSQTEYWTTGAQPFFTGLRIKNKSVWLMVDSSLYETHTLTYILIETLPEYEYNKLNNDFISIDANTMYVNSVGELASKAPIAGNRIESTVIQLVKSGQTANKTYLNQTSPNSAVFGYDNILGGATSFIAGSYNYHNGAGRGYIIGKDNKINAAYGCHLIGDENTAGANYSYMMGKYNESTNTNTYLFGEGLYSGSALQTAVGHWNSEDGLDSYSFFIGCGTGSGDRRNAMTINLENNASFGGTITSQGADYAEYFEWADGNPEAEDRVGYIVALKGDKIVKAQAEDEVLGIISGTVAVLGDNYEWHWSGKYLTDDFGRVIYDLVDKYSEPEEEGEEPIFLGQVKVPRINPEWDATKEYLNRANRAEWDTVGMFGKLFVRDDGSCVVGEYAATGADGLATLATGKTNMYVMERINENIVKVLLK